MNETQRATGDAQDGAQRTPQVGALLKASRLRVGEDLRDVADVLCIRFLYLEAIEECRYGDLPGSTYAVGFIRSYASHLGLDGEEVVRRFRAEQAGVKRSNDLFFPTPVTESGVPKGAIVFIGVLLALIAYGGWYASNNDDGFFANLISPVPERLSGKAETKKAEASATVAQTAEPSAAKTADTSSEPAKTDEAPKTEAASAAQDSEKKPDSQPQIAETPAVPAASPPTLATALKTPAKPQTAPPASTSAPVTITPVAPQANNADQEQEEATPAPTAIGRSPVTTTDTATPAPTPSTALATVPQPAARTETAAAPTAQTAAQTTGQTAAPAATVGAIVIKANSASYIEVFERADNKIIHQGLLAAGASYTVPNRDGLGLNTGNAGALDILVDGVRVPALGADGDVRYGIMLDPSRLKSGTALP